MSRSLVFLFWCGCFFAMGTAWGQSTPSSWPSTNPIRPENPADANPQTPGGTNAPNASTYPPRTPSNFQANSQQNPAPNSQQNPPSTGRYPTDRYPAGRNSADRYAPQNPVDRYPTDRNPTDHYPAERSASSTTNPAWGQARPVQPDQPVVPNHPTLERREASGSTPAAPPTPPFQLTATEQAQVDKLLTVWEQKSHEIKTFDSSFMRWEYDLTFPIKDPKAPPGSPPLPNSKDQGILKYAAPDKGMYRIVYTEKNGKMEPTPPERVEHWLCDGKSLFEYNYSENRLVERPLPPEMQGKAISDGPLPFLFGAEAQKLRERYYFRIITPLEKRDQIWLEAYPKTQQGAANFSRAILILNLADMTPKALQIFLPGGANYTSYEFFDVVINDQFRIFKGDPFRPFVPRGWQKVVEPTPDSSPRSTPSSQVLRSMPSAR